MIKHLTTWTFWNTQNNNNNNNRRQESYCFPKPGQVGGVIYDKPSAPQLSPSMWESPKETTGLPDPEAVSPGVVLSTAV